MDQRKNIALKFITLVLGLFILAFGIALSSKSGLGVSPSASLAYVLSRIFPLSMGMFTTLINIFFVILQIVLLRKDYKITNLLQLVVVFIFGYFTDLTLMLVEPLEVNSYILRLLLCIVSCIIMAFGVFLEVKAGLMVMASEGAITAISKLTGKDFGFIKIILDWGFIILSTVISLIAFRSLVGVREGTVIAAFLVGTFVRIYNRKLGFVDRILGRGETAAAAGTETAAAGGKLPLVITIERELGSGGNEIGAKIAEKLGIAFYDYALIEEAAKATGLPSEIVEEGEERLGRGIMYSLYQNSYAMSQMTSRQDEIFEAQKKIILDIAAKESCVIVGRLGSFILKDRPGTFDVFLSGDRRARAERVSKRHGISFEKALENVEREDRLRVNYCSHFTGMPWGLAAHYDMTLHTSDYGIERSADLILEAIGKYKENSANEGYYPKE